MRVTIFDRRNGNKLETIENAWAVAIVDRAGNGQAIEVNVNNTLNMSTVHSYALHQVRVSITEEKEKGK